MAKVRIAQGHAVGRVLSEGPAAFATAVPPDEIA